MSIRLLLAFLLTSFGTVGRTQWNLCSAEELQEVTPTFAETVAAKAVNKHRPPSYEQTTAHRQTIARASAMETLDEKTSASNRESSNRGPRDTEFCAEPRGPLTEPTGLDSITAISLSPVFQSSAGPKSSYQPKYVTSDQRDPYMGGSYRTRVNWVTDNLAHRPLYFADTPLERHGQSLPFLQPTASFLRFIVDAAKSPIAILRPRQEACHYTQCDGRPGSP